MTSSLSALLLQARAPADPILEHERDCFVRQSGLDPHQVRTVNLPEMTRAHQQALFAADVVFVGGAGEFSVVRGGFRWHGMLGEVMREVVATRTPMFASCFGFQALVQALGGELVQDPERAELGTWAITLSREGLADPVFGGLPPIFDAQLGHHDSAVGLPNELCVLAGSARCPIQAVAHTDAPIWATQFHPELTDLDNITRYVRYIEAYKAPGDSLTQARQKARQMHWPSPHANSLIPRFLAHCFGPTPALP